MVGFDYRLRCGGYSRIWVIGLDIWPRHSLRSDFSDSRSGFGV